MTKTILAGLIGLLLAGASATAQAAAPACPAVPPAQIAFEATPSPLPQDTNASAGEIAVKLGATRSERAPGFYEASASVGARRDTAVTKMPNGTICAAVAKLTVKIGFERKLWLAKELTADPCVLAAFANSYGARAKADDEVAAQFGQTVLPTYQAQLNAIGWQMGTAQDAVTKELGEKIAPIVTDIQTKFLAARADAQKKVVVSKLPTEACNGATAKIGQELGFTAP